MRISNFPGVLFVFLLAVSPIFADGSVIVYTSGHSIKVATADGEGILRLEYRLWGPNWAWTGIDGRYAASESDENTVVGNFSGKVGGTGVPFTFQAELKSVGKRQLVWEGSFQTESDSDLHLAGIGLVFDAHIRGPGRGDVTDASGTRTIDLPLGIGKVSDTLRKVEMKDAEGKIYSITLEPDLSASHDGEIRIMLAENRIQAATPKKYKLTLDLPVDTAFYLGPESVPNPPDWKFWFPWTATSDTKKPSVIDASGLLEAPAGKHGRIRSDGDRLLYNGKPITLWGLNTCYAPIASPKDVSERRAAFYAKYGVNAVRLHKFADGATWDGVLNSKSYTKYNPEKLALMDYYVAALKKRGIYVLLSANFGRARIYSEDLDRVPYASEFGEAKNGVIDPGGGALFLSTELQDIQIEQLVNLLKHPNAETGLNYAEDPAVMCVELVNEDCAFFYNVMGAMDRSPTLKNRAGEDFAAWLAEKYGTEEKLLDAWGKVLNVFVGEKATGEAWNDGKGPIYPIGNPWFYDPDQIDGGMMSGRRQRLLDTMLFWFDKQNEFYDRFVKAIRETGYDGEIVASNWQAGRATSHFLNLYSDRRIGMIDRHNYFGGPSSMLSIPGSGILSTGMQQVADRPFMLSEWIHTFPSEFCVEGPAIIGAYGMGLNGWDVSFMFQNFDNGRFRETLGETWDVVAPQVFGLFPAVSRQVIRRDVAESKTVFARNVDFESLREGKLNFDDRIDQRYDFKDFSSDTTPIQSLAAGRVVVDFVEKPTKTETVDLSKYVKGRAILSGTKELAWYTGQNPRGGRILINTPRTQAVVGFTGDYATNFNDVSIRIENPYAAVYLTSLDDEPIADSRHLLITTIARARNTDMKLVGGELIDKGKAPILMEPVVAELEFKRSMDAIVFALDHDGCRTDDKVPFAEGKLRLDGRKTRTIYYEIVR